MPHSTKLDSTHSSRIHQSAPSCKTWVNWKQKKDEEQK
jgi:hypothetical protein